MSNTFSQNTDKKSKNSIPLSDAQPDCVYTVTKCDLPKHLQNRFAELGFVKGTRVTVLKKAPLGDPMEIKIMGYALCARASELSCITVVKEDDE